jgi:short-chain fatty acids transporter
MKTLMQGSLRPEGITILDIANHYWDAASSTNLNGAWRMMRSLGRIFSRVSHRYVPDPFVLAIGLTAVVCLLALPRLDYDFTRLAHGWVEGDGKGLWRFLAFSMQMCLILVTGFALAETPLIRRLVARLSAIPKTTQQATTLVSIVAMSAALVNWGLGLIVGALLARSIGAHARRTARSIHYPLVCAAGYTGLAVWHAGLSGSAPLKATSQSQLLEILGPELGARVAPISTLDSIGSSLNLTVIALCFLMVPSVLALLAPAPQDVEAFQGDDPEPITEPQPASTPAEHLNQSRIVIALPVLLSAIWALSWFSKNGISKLNPNVINLIMLTTGMALHGSAKAYAVAIGRAISSCAGIVLQYPFYAGIMALLGVSGLVGDLGSLLAGLEGTSLCVATFYSSGLVNLLVPSGGGQWAVQGPIIMQAALESGVEPAHALMALAYGDQWTNLIQPFWALPLLGICQIKASKLMGYTVILLIFMQVCFLLPFFFLV